MRREVFENVSNSSRVKIKFIFVFVEKNPIQSHSELNALDGNPV